ncbi:uncharacterized protein K452DRAFT_272718 [Aplosporella prunicola CBS 121167]|uniref:Uncharacterized protein n=1 Tax=Aplosporella prunicola CBS 121167 TaxID=1176127 RepID=A0A6A6BBJ3_9PEZI|nr:uncharacterized protein K452DRAFT_272718 [Aplosporella prunicola CBS 121167]KAF2140968.1 hypothetical protein K452DRAFT_272718 [Aplosporella prunicola CBS 121167]
MDAFEYNANPSRVVFGSGTLKKLPAELSRLNVKAPLILSTPGQAQQATAVRAVLANDIAGIFTEAAMHTPTDVTDKAVAFAQAQRADSVVSIGGGSTIGLGKAISFRTGVPHVCVPTTYAGSEMTPILGETAAGQKTTRSDPRILPATVVYDVELTLTLPVKLSMESGLNAVAHAVEALYAQNANPITSLLATEGIRALASALPTLLTNPTSPSPRSTALYGAYLCGTALGSASMALHHKLCHALGGTLNLPHAATHAAVLPHALAYNLPALPEETRRRLADALVPGAGAGEDAVTGLNKLVGKLGVGGGGLRALGMREEDVDAMVDKVLARPYWNPRKVEREGVREVVRRAWAGEEARADL